MKARVSWPVVDYVFISGNVYCILSIVDSEFLRNSGLLGSHLLIKSSSPLTFITIKNSTFIAGNTSAGVSVEFNGIRKVRYFER